MPISRDIKIGKRFPVRSYRRPVRREQSFVIDLRCKHWGKLAAERRAILDTRDCSDAECARLLKLEETMPQRNLNDAGLFIAMNILEEDGPYADQLYNRT